MLNRCIKVKLFGYETDILLDWQTISFVLAAIVIAVLRVVGFKSQSFQAVAHLYEGFFVGAAYVVWRINETVDWGAIALAVFLAVVETVVFVLSLL